MICIHSYTLSQKFTNTPTFITFCARVYASVLSSSYMVFLVFGMLYEVLLQHLLKFHRKTSHFPYTIVIITKIEGFIPGVYELFYFTHTAQPRFLFSSFPFSNKPTIKRLGIPGLQFHRYKHYCSYIQAFEILIKLVYYTHAFQFHITLLSHFKYDKEIHDLVNINKIRYTRTRKNTKNTQELDRY